MDTKHNPEFTTIEAYEAYGDMYSMMDLAEGLIRYTSKEVLGRDDAIKIIKEALARYDECFENGKLKVNKNDK